MNEIGLAPPPTDTEKALPFDAKECALLLARQDGVVSRRQLLELHAKPHEIRRMIRRRELTVVHRGVYVNHTGPLTWDQRAWAAVLVHWPAALARQSALPKPPLDGPIHVAVAMDRTVKPTHGVIAHRTTAIDERVNWVASPPRVRPEHAAIDVAMTKKSVADRFKVFADVCQSRRTTPGAIVAALEPRQGVGGKRLMLDLLSDLAIGACSVLEREYLRLERLHGLPAGNRQAATRVNGRKAYLDVPYEQYGFRVELDGGAYHDSAGARDRDAERDLVGAVESDDVTVRLTYGQVFDRGCLTLQRVGILLGRRGWPGPFRRCPRCADSKPEVTG